MEWLVGLIPISILVGSWIAYRHYRGKKPRAWCEYLLQLAEQHAKLRGQVDLRRRQAPTHVELQHNGVPIRIALEAEPNDDLPTRIELTAPWLVPAGREVLAPFARAAPLGGLR